MVAQHRLVILLVCHEKSPLSSQVRSWMHRTARSRQAGVGQFQPTSTTQTALPIRNDFPRSDFINGLDAGGKILPKVVKSIRGEWNTRIAIFAASQVLLVSQVCVYRNQHIKVGFRDAQKVAVLFSGPNPILALCGTSCPASARTRLSAFGAHSSSKTLI